MTLKNECLQLVRAIVDNHNNNTGNFGYYEIVEDTELQLLAEHGYENIAYWFGDDPGDILRDPVDIEFYHCGIMDSEADYVCFNRKPDKRLTSKITYINNHKQLTEYITRLINRLEEDMLDYKRFAKNIMELQDYAVEFVEQVKRDFPIFSTVDSDSLPISFYPTKKDTDGNYVFNTQGDFVVKNPNIVIRIFNMWEDSESCRITIRHEILHYMLFLKGIPHADDSAIFWYLATKYNAQPYKQMPENEQALYDLFIKNEGSVKIFMVWKSKIAVWSFVEDERTIRISELMDRASETLSDELVREVYDLLQAG